MFNIDLARAKSDASVLILIIKTIKFKLINFKPLKRNLQRPYLTLGAFCISLPFEGKNSHSKRKKSHVYSKKKPLCMKVDYSRRILPFYVYTEAEI